MVMKNNHKIKTYPQWFIKEHACVQHSKWVEVWAFIDSDDTYICPIGVCPKCLEIVEIEDELKIFMEKRK